MLRHLTLVIAGTEPAPRDNVIPFPKSVSPTVPMVDKVQAAAMVEELRANGVPAEKIAEALAADGLTIADLPDAKASELRS